ncbi:MAG: AAA family ATPase [Nitrospira sp.]|nr:AAA family ATPase [Nitrospira sp.]
MKIGKLTVQNVTSYRLRTEFTFDKQINILIGPNGGGKSNLQLILAVVLTKFFIHQYQIRKVEDESKIEIADVWNKKTLARTLDKYIGDDGDQEIEIELVPEHRDLENIKAIGNNLNKFNEHLSFFEKKYDSYEPLGLVEDIEKAHSFTYRIRNLELEQVERNTPAWGFLEYLNTFFIFMRVVHHVPDISLSSPVFFFSSERALTKNFDIQAGNLTEESYHNGFRTAYNAATGQNTNLLQWSAQHFVRLYRRSQVRASNTREAVVRDFLEKEPDVILLRRYLAQLGYDWEFLFDEEQTTFRFILIKDGAQISADMFSSGEREIVHFLLAMFALNVRDGLVLVDEPELHLHPRWQRIFLGLFRELAPERNNQFIISTHSPVFVTPDTINSITRVYRMPSKGSSKIALSEISLPDKKKLVQMINSQNNERLFFADKVVLVEGISDRLVLASLFDAASARFANNAAIEIIDVGGKKNFKGYQRLLKALGTPWVVVADRDYLTDIGSPQVKALFEADSEKKWKVLTEDKKSTDRRAMIECLGQAIDNKDVGQLRSFWDYFRSRHQRMREDLNKTETEVLAKELAKWNDENILIFRFGEIEDYLPVGVSDVSAIIELISDRNWINKIEDESRRLELGRLICHILDVSEETALKFYSELFTRALKFPKPISDRGEQELTC